MWGPTHTQPTNQESPDSHEDRLGRVRHVVQEERRANIQQGQVLVAEEFIRSVISRVGPMRRSQDQIPRSFRRQQWSALNVPLMWAAAEGDRDCGVLRWLRSRADTLPPLSVGGEDVSAHDAAVVGWALNPDKTCRNGFTTRVSHVPDGEPISAGEHRNGSGTQRSTEMCAEWAARRCTSTL